jgi:hypothetical protein
MLLILLKLVLVVRGQLCSRVGLQFVLVVSLREIVIWLPQSIWRLLSIRVFVPLAVPLRSHVDHGLLGLTVARKSRLVVAPKARALSLLGWNSNDGNLFGYVWRTRTYTAEARVKELEEQLEEQEGTDYVV